MSPDISAESAYNNTRQLPERWLKKKTIAELFSAGVSTVESWVRDGCPSRTVGGNRLFLYSEVDAWLNSREEV
ncbi:MAG: helix-turn-helix transcriptional regulator [Solirubrobacteraceae bacterium]